MPVTYQSAIESADNSCCNHRGPEIKSGDCETKGNQMVSETGVGHLGGNKKAVIL